MWCLSSKFLLSTWCCLSRLVEKRETPKDAKPTSPSNPMVARMPPVLSSPPNMGGSSEPSRNPFRIPLDSPILANPREFAIALTTPMGSSMVVKLIDLSRKTGSLNLAEKKLKKGEFLHLLPLF